MTLRMDCMCDSCVEQKYPLEPEWCITEAEEYFCGVSPPNYPVPAIPVRVGFMPDRCDGQQPYPSAYWYVSSDNLLWTFWEHWGLTVERR